MKVLFVSRWKENLGISPIVRNQGDSLIKLGIEPEYFLIKGKGFIRYLESYIHLVSFLRKNDFDIIHAHYSFCGYIAGLTFNRKRLVVSLMGGDTERKGTAKLMIKLFSRFLWRKTIVKSEQMRKHFLKDEIIVLPNGVDFSFFRPLPRDECMAITGFDKNKKHILFFLSHSGRREKNLPLAEEAFRLLEDNTVEFHIIDLVPAVKVPVLLNASDVLLLTSTSEGSPNIIKEAMACNIPVVSTDVGDVRKTIGSTEGCFITSFSAIEIKEALQKALSFNSRTKGREYINFLDSRIIAGRLIEIYNDLVKI